MNAPETTAFHSKLLERDDSHADDLLSYRTFAAKLEKERDDAKALVSERESRLANIKFLLEPIYGSTNYAPIGGTLDRVLNICDRNEESARLPIDDPRRVSF